MLILVLQENRQFFGEALRFGEELGNRMSHQEVSVHTENGEGGRVGFDAGSLVVENQNAVEGILENGLELAPSNIESVGRFPIVPVQEDQVSGVERDSEAEPAQRGDEKIGCQSSVAKSGHKNGGKENDRSEKNEKSASFEPTRLKARRAKFFRQLFVCSHELLASNSGGSFERIRENVGSEVALWYLYP